MQNVSYCRLHEKLQWRIQNSNKHLDERFHENNERKLFNIFAETFVLDVHLRCFSSEHFSDIYTVISWDAILLDILPFKSCTHCHTLKQTNKHVNMKILF